jgi:hypothetical protein
MLLINLDASDALERKRLREMDEKFCERLAAAIERGQERTRKVTLSRAQIIRPLKKMARNGSGVVTGQDHGRNLVS